jgi:hypothetical protein
MKTNARIALSGASLLLAVAMATGCGGEDPYAIVECSSPDKVPPIDYTTQPMFSPASLEEPKGSWQLEPGVVALAYDASYLTQIQRANGASSFRGTALLDPLPVPAGVQAAYGDTVSTYVIVPESCMPK